MNCQFEGVWSYTQPIDIETQAVLFENQIKTRIISEGETRVLNTPSQNTTSENVKKTNIASGTLEEIGNGLAMLTVLDERDQPLSGASVQVDGGAKKITDAKGQVTVQIGTSGSPYTLTIEAPNYHTFEYKGQW